MLKEIAIDLPSAGPAIYSRDNLLSHEISVISLGLSREEWLQALPQALGAGSYQIEEKRQIERRFLCQVVVHYSNSWD
jgi:hypothetical protein